MAAGDEVGRYRLEAQLAQGAWRAVDGQSGERVRLRYVDPFGEPPVFMAGARRLCSLDEPRVLTLRDAGVDPAGQAWVAEPWQPGETLAERVARTGPLPADQLLIVAEALLSGLAAAHARGICDGAITPERLRISGDATLKVHVVTPGLAALIMDLVPDPMFSPPEGSVPTVPADLFGTAATLCFAATGQTVPSGRALELATPRLPTPLVDTLRMCLDPDPSDRPHSVGALLRTVEALRAGTLDWGDRPADPPALAAGVTADLGPRRGPTPLESAATAQHTPQRPADPGPQATRPERASARPGAARASDRPGGLPAPASEPAADVERPSALRPRRPSALIDPPSLDDAPPTPASLVARFGDPGSLAAAAPLPDISADETLPPPTSPDAPPMPVRTADLPVAFSFGKGEPAAAPATGLEVLELRDEPRPRWTPEEPAAPVAAEVRPAPPPVRRPPPTTARVEAPASKSLWLGAGAVLAVGVAGVVAWSLLRDPPAPPLGASAVSAAPPPVREARDARVADDGPLDGGDPPSPLPRDAYVVVIPEPGPARFVQVPTGVVLCEEARACDVPIDVDTRIEKAGYKARVIPGDDLYDRRGGRWRIKLYPGR